MYPPCPAAPHPPDQGLEQGCELLKSDICDSFPGKHEMNCCMAGHHLVASPHNMCDKSLHSRVDPAFSVSIQQWY